MDLIKQFVKYIYIFFKDMFLYNLYLNDVYFHTFITFNKYLFLE